MLLRPLLLPLLATFLLAGCTLGRPPEPKAPPPTWTTSPNGEPLPFRAGRDDCKGALAAWFDAADRNGDGSVDMDEMVADAARWFAIADMDHDGQITPGELAEVRARLLPPEPEETEQGPPGGDGRGPGRAPRIPRSQARVDLVMQADANADFRVTAQEFRAWTIERMAGRALTRPEALVACDKAAAENARAGGGSEGPRLMGPPRLTGPDSLPR